jgi:hypothetical protein
MRAGEAGEQKKHLFGKAMLCDDGFCNALESWRSIPAPPPPHSPSPRLLSLPVQPVALGVHLRLRSAVLPYKAAVSYEAESVHTCVLQLPTTGARIKQLPVVPKLQFGTGRLNWAPADRYRRDMSDQRAAASQLRNLKRLAIMQAGKLKTDFTADIKCKLWLYAHRCTCVHASQHNITDGQVTSNKCVELRDNKLETTPPSFTYRRSLPYINKSRQNLQNAGKEESTAVIVTCCRYSKGADVVSCRRVTVTGCDRLSLFHQTLIQTLACFMYWHRTVLVCTHRSTKAQCVCLQNGITTSRKHNAQANMHDAVHTTARTRWKEQATHRMTAGVL